jgi:glycosyltransferase involved in cell wall biosynthesis
MKKKEIMPLRPGDPTVLFVIDTLEIGGAEQSLLDNISRFHKIRPVVCHLYQGNMLKTSFEEKGIRVWSGGLRQKYGFPDACRQLGKVIRSERPGLIVAYLTRSEIAARITGRLYHVPVIGTFVSDLYSTAYNRSLSWRSRQGVAFFKWMNRLTARWCCGFIANSEAVRSAATRHLGISPARISVINRGRDGRLFTFRSRNVSGAKPARFLNIGRLVSVKGQQELILAFAAFSRQYPEDTLDIAGDGPCKQSLSALIREQGLENKVTLLGVRQDMPGLMDNYDCFVSASASEGFSGVVVEAMFGGLPVLAGDIPANREVIRHKETGFLFRSGSVLDMADALCWYRTHQAAANEWAYSAGKYARQHFELEKIASEMEIYLQMKLAGKNENTSSYSATPVARC